MVRLFFFQWEDSNNQAAASKWAIVHTRGINVLSVLEKRVSSELANFAGNKKLLKLVTPGEEYEEIQRDLTKLGEWSTQWNQRPNIALGIDMFRVCISDIKGNSCFLRAMNLHASGHEQATKMKIKKKLSCWVNYKRLLQNPPIPSIEWPVSRTVASFKAFWKHNLLAYLP